MATCIEHTDEMLPTPPRLGASYVVRVGAFSARNLRENEPISTDVQYPQSHIGLEYYIVLGRFSAGRAGPTPPLSCSVSLPFISESCLDLD